MLYDNYDERFRIEPTSEQIEALKELWEEKKKEFVQEACDRLDYEYEVYETYGEYIEEFLFDEVVFS